MTSDEILKIARDCGIHVPTVNHSCISNKEELIAFAAAVELVTLERAAQVCDRKTDEYLNPPIDGNEFIAGYCEEAVRLCAEQIRALATPDKES